MPTISRSAIEFLRRHGVRSTPRVPHPRLDLSALKVLDIPLHRRQLDPNLMTSAEGNPAPDRGVIDLWPPPQEVQNVPETSEASE